MSPPPAAGKTLAALCEPMFPRQDRERGRNYFLQQRVDLTKRSEGSATAIVHGAGTQYWVDVDWTSTGAGRTLDVRCDCPRFEKTQACKHLWATVLEIDHEGLYARSVRHDDASFPDAEFDPEVLEPSPVSLTRSRVSAGRPQPWRKQFENLESALSTDRNDVPMTSGHVYRLSYVIDIGECFSRGRFVIRFHRRRILKNGSLGGGKFVGLSNYDYDRYLPADDQPLMELLLKNHDGYDRVGYGSLQQVTLPDALAGFMLERLAHTGRLHWCSDGKHSFDESAPLQWDAGPQFSIEVHARNNDQGDLSLSGELVRAKERIAVEAPLIGFRNGLILFPNRIAALDPKQFSWFAFLRQQGPVVIPRAEAQDAVKTLYELPHVSRLEVPSELALERVDATPTPRVRLQRPNQNIDLWQVELWFDYADTLVHSSDARPNLVIDDKIVSRDFAREQEVASEVERSWLALPPKWRQHSPEGNSIRSAALAEMAGNLLMHSGWQVEAEAIRIRQPSSAEWGVSSNLNWLEVRMGMTFDGESVAIPEILAAVKQASPFVRLDDGSRGLVPPKWLARVQRLAELSSGDDSGLLQFHRGQALFIDALLETEPHVRVDTDFARLRKKMSSFTGIRPVKTPRGFAGTLRQYQIDGLSWLRFVQEIEFGACLADDMGLGKTIQLLAHLLYRRRAQPSGERLPSLVVAPKSVVHNWLAEAARFTPTLKVHDHTGPDRNGRLAELDSPDIWLTTYGTLRRDILTLRESQFDVIVLDEAQAIKNASSQTAKAARLLRGRHRLALTGTPIENHVGELGSLFDFLNPGMLSRLLPTGAKKTARLSPEELEALARAIRPFLLRRTKQEVLPELPPKTEQTLVIPIDGRQRKVYNELLRYYRESLASRIEREGIAKSKIHILEALLRLRQVACHPALVDDSYSGVASAKLDTLVEFLESLVSEGHKALVFSQFTRLLAIAAARLKESTIAYEYLDGKTRDRKKRIERFNSDPDCPVFLISLKAGGLGLNLTAADYVFILDPWWNPAVEAQAVDRAHRIGQDKPVFAYRLIAQDTVEEKILTLQEKKRTLVEAILSEKNSLVTDLTADDLQLLLS